MITLKLGYSDEHKFPNTYEGWKDMMAFLQAYASSKVGKTEVIIKPEGEEQDNE